MSHCAAEHIAESRSVQRSSASSIPTLSRRSEGGTAPIMKFDAGISGTFSGAPASESRPVDTSHDSGLIPDVRLSTSPTTSKSRRIMLCNCLIKCSLGIARCRHTKLKAVVGRLHYCAKLLYKLTLRGAGCRN